MYLPIGRSVWPMKRLDTSNSRLQNSRPPKCSQVAATGCCLHWRTTGPVRVMISVRKNSWKHLHALLARRYVAAYDLATVYVGLRDDEGALKYLDKAFQERSP